MISVRLLSFVILEMYVNFTSPSMSTKATVYSTFSGQKICTCLTFPCLTITIIDVNAITATTIQ